MLVRSIYQQFGIVLVSEMHGNWKGVYKYKMGRGSGLACEGFFKPGLNFYQFFSSAWEQLTIL